VQRSAGVFHDDFGSNPLRTAADPWILAEAQLRGWTVVTYEGRTFSGVPTANWQKSMPGNCGQYAIACITLPEALGRLGGSF
jgi:hypothetical protein